jgi:hypothetical protein
MKGLSKERLRELEASTRIWQTRARMAQLSANLSNGLPAPRFFSGEGKLAREAWIANRVAVAPDAQALRLVDDQWPDFELKSTSGVEHFEITEADLPGRRRHDEYREIETDARPRLVHDPVEKWIERAGHIPLALARAAGAKAAKGYPKNSQLVIYLNIDEWGIRHNEIVAQMVKATKAAASAFKSVSVLWKGRLYLTWRDGKPLGLSVNALSEEDREI